MIPPSLPIDKIVSFIEKQCPVYRGKSQEIRKIVLTHIRYGTFDYLEDDKGIVFALRYNIDGEEAKVLDLVISPKYRRNIPFLKLIISSNWMRFPYLKKISYERYFKYKNHKRRNIDLLKLLK